MHSIPSGDARRSDALASFGPNDGQDPARHTGVIEAVLPNGLYGVRLDDGSSIRAGLGPEARHATVRLLAGHRVLVKLSPVDDKRGRIVAKL